MPRHSSDYRHYDDDKHKRKYDCCKSCYKSKKSCSRERSDSSVSDSTLSNSCYCKKCSPESKNEKPQIVICKKDDSSRQHKVCCDKCDKSVVIVINMN